MIRLLSDARVRLVACVLAMAVAGGLGVVTHTKKPVTRPEGAGKSRSPLRQAICSATSGGSCDSHRCTAHVASGTISQREVAHVSVPTMNRSG